MLAQKFYNNSPKDVNTGTDSDLRDSDAELKNDGCLEISFMTGLAGETNHALDFGLIKCEPIFAGDDLTFCQPTSTANLIDATPTQKWMYLSGPGTAAIDSTTGDVIGMTTPGIYKFILIYRPAGLNCSDTLSITIKEKPNAGVDLIGTNGLCMPTSKTKLTATPAGGTWSAVATNPAPTLIDANGNVSGMTNAGIYQFIYTLNGCADSVKVEIKQKPNAGIDQSYCFPKQTTQITATPAGGTWSAVATNPAPTLIDANGNVSGMTNAGIYQFIYTLNGCADSVKVEIKQKPNAGNDLLSTNALCLPITNYKVTGTPSGGAWTLPSTNPELLTIDASGNVSTMTKEGIYEFIYTLPNGCSDTLKVESKSCAIGSLGDFVWKDTNKNGLQDNDETGVYGVKVDLFRNGIFYATTNTDAAGKYLFSNLTAGTYKIKIASATIPIDCKISPLKDTGDDTKDSDVNPTTGESGDYVINPDDPTKRHILTVDAGLEPVCTIVCLPAKIKKIRQ